MINILKPKRRSTVTREEVSPAPSSRRAMITTRRLVAATLWGFAAYTTGVMLFECGLADLQYLIPTAMILQGAFTAMEHDVWRGRLHILGLLAFCMDVLSNAAGVWFLVLNIEQTGIYEMLAQVFVKEAETGIVSRLPAELPLVSKFGFAVIVGAMLAFSPESVWE